MDLLKCEECKNGDHINCENAWTWDDICGCEICDRIWYWERETGKKILIPNT